MAKLELNNNMIMPKTTQKIDMRDNSNGVLELVRSGIDIVNTLAGIVNSVDSTLLNRKTNEADVSVKLGNVEIEKQKEANRHSEEMARISREWKEISDKAEDREKRLSFIKNYCSKFGAEYDKYMEMDKKDFLSDDVTERLKQLREVMVELIKELN